MLRLGLAKSKKRDKPCIGNPETRDSPKRAHLKKIYKQKRKGDTTLTIRNLVIFLSNFGIYNKRSLFFMEVYAYAAVKISKETKSVFLIIDRRTAHIFFKKEREVIL